MEATMDTFMDQLSQKLNAQQIIRANGEAESEAMGVMRAQVREYQECLDRMKSVAEELSGLQQTINALPDLGGVEGGASQAVINDLKEQMESMNKANEDYLQQMQNDLLAGQNDFIERQQSLAMSQNELMSRQSQMLEERSNELKEQIESIKAANEENLEKIRSGLTDGGNEELTRRLNLLEEQIGTQLEDLKARVGSQIDAVRSSNEEYLTRMQSEFSSSAANDEVSSKMDVLRDDVSAIKLQMDSLKNANDKSLEQVKNDLRQGQQKMLEAQNSLLSSLQNADVHKECVRVYRNVQASIQDENAKQLESIRQDNQSKADSIRSESGKTITAIRDESAKLLGSIRNDNAKQIDAIREENAKFLVSIRTETTKLEEQVGTVKKIAVVAVIVSVISIAAPFVANFLF